MNIQIKLKKLIKSKIILYDQIRLKYEKYREKLVCELRKENLNEKKFQGKFSVFLNENIKNWKRIFYTQKIIYFWKKIMLPELFSGDYKLFEIGWMMK